MKISKLFHWLYAFVMFLPFFAIGVTCGYAMFNKNAYQSYYGETINEENYTQLNNTNELNNEDIYHFQCNKNETYNVETGNMTIFIDDFDNKGNLSGLTFIPDRITYYYYNNYVQIQFKTETQTYATSNELYSFNFNFKYVSSSGSLVLSNFLQYVSKVTFNNDSFLSEVFYYSVDKVTQAPLFSWAYNSFLAQPLVYIVTLFSIPANHVVVQLLSYWLAISIIWLVFDLIMYVPLLVHRWLDKGVLE